MRELLSFLDKEKERGKLIYPPDNMVMEAFRLTPLGDVKVVILGQDPYHGPNQAHGLAFSVPKGIIPPPSLKNIFKELKNDISVPQPQYGCLDEWARQGVLLLNTVLTVEAGKARSHQNLGWEIFTDKVIEVLNHEKSNLVFILWGSQAQKKADRVDKKNHLILNSVHPSPLSFYRGFLGSSPFSKTNQYLVKHGLSPINWQLKE